MKLPTKRTGLKFLRDLGLAIAAVAIAYVADNAASLEMGTTETAVLVAVCGFVFRWIRGLTGSEPA